LHSKDLQEPFGRFEKGETYQMMEVYNPQGGVWNMEIRWKDPPPEGEQVNILISEKSDLFANILPFQNQNRLRQPVDIRVQVMELIGDKRVPLNNAVIKIEIKKPGPEFIRMVHAQSENWIMYKDTMLDITRNLNLFDDGGHNDNDSGDGTFANTFSETDKNGAYLITATITGMKQNSGEIKKILKGSFQVGSISKNTVTSSQVLNYISRSDLLIDERTPYKEETMSEPSKEIEKLQSDPLESINRLLKGEN